MTTTKWFCEKADGHGKLCGRPAKYVLVSPHSNVMLCGIHARRHIDNQNAWRKLIGLEKVTILGSETGRIVTSKPNFRLVKMEKKND